MHTKNMSGTNTSTAYLSRKVQSRILDTLRQPSLVGEFMKTLWLFTKNDFLTFAIPTTLFATFGALAGPVLTTNSSPDALLILLRVPIALLIVWANLLVFDISNQRSPDAVEEDAVNKPHRPLPSGRISIDASRRLLLVGIPFVLSLSWALGCWQETLLLYCFTWMYNDLKGCDEDCVIRNLLIAIGYGLYSSAALRVTTGPAHTVNSNGFAWIGMVTLVMFITQHICDLKDQEGDKLRGRRSIPIVLGDDLARWTVAVPIMFCSAFCPFFFRLRLLSYVSTLSIGFLVAFRTIKYRDLKSDKATWKLWAFWTCWLFGLPLASDPGCLVEAYKAARTLVCPGEDCSGSLNLVAVSGMTLLLESRRLYGHYAGSSFPDNGTLASVGVEKI